MRKRVLSALLALCMALILLPSVAVAASAITVTTEAELSNAIGTIGENGTITLGANIAIAKTLVINNTNPFVIDLNGKMLYHSSSTAIQYLGTGALTITDSSGLGGGKVETIEASASAIESAGVGKLTISGKATISAAYEAITILSPETPFNTVLEITGGTVNSTGNSAISNASFGQVNVIGGTITGGNGIISTSGGNVVVTGGTVTGTSGNAIRIDSDGVYGGMISLMGGTIEITGSTSAIYCDAFSQLKIIRGSVIIYGTISAMNAAPILTSYTSYQWRTSESGDYTLSTTQAYSYDDAHTYVEFKPYTPTYAVAYHPGTNGTGSEVMDTKTKDVALTLKDDIFTRGNYIQTGWATIDGGTKAYDLGGSYTANAAINLYPFWTSAIFVSNQNELATALTNIDENGTIKLAGNIDLSVTFILSNGKPFTIDLNGYTLTSNSDRGIFEVNSGTLTISDSSDAKTGKITSTGGDEGFGAINVNGGNLVVDSGTVENRNTNAGVYTIAVSAGTVTVTGGTITGSSDHAIFSKSDGSISVSGGQLNSKSSAIYCYDSSSCDIDVTGGTLYSDDFFAIFNSGSGNLNVAGTAWVEGKNAASSGAIYYTGTGTFTICGTAVITSPRSSDTGGTIYLGNNSFLNITGGTVQNTYAGDTGNAIFTPNPIVGVFIASTSPVIIKGSGSAMTGAPYLTNTIVKTAATNINGTDGVETYNPNSISTYKYLKFEPAAASIGNTGYASAQAAIDAVENDDTITLFSDITEKIVIPSGFNRSFTLDLNGKTLSGGINTEESNTISYSGSGVLTITDSSGSGGGTITKGTAPTDNGAVIQSSGAGKIIVGGNADISATGTIMSFYIASGTATISDVVLEISGGTVGSSTQGCAIENGSFGKVLVLGGTISGGTGISCPSAGEITISGGTIIGSQSHAIVNDIGSVILKGGTVDNHTGTGETIRCTHITIDPVGLLIIKGNVQALNSAPSFATSYQWRISNSDAFMPSARMPYDWSADHIYLETKPAYSVTYHPGANGTGSITADAKTIDVALTLRGAIFTRNGFTQTGWAITDGGVKAYALGGSYANNAAIDLYPVWAQSPSAPGGSGSETTLLTGNTVYNDASIPDATIWLSGNGLSRGDILVTETITNGSSYNTMLTLADSGDIMQMYDISLQSGRTFTGSAMYLTFDLTRQYAGQEFTLVHKKADGTFEYLYAKAGVDGKVKFGPVYELSPFMLVKGRLLHVPTEEVVNVPKTGGALSPLTFILLPLAVVCGAIAAVYRKRRA